MAAEVRHLIGEYVSAVEELREATESRNKIEIVMTRCENKVQGLADELKHCVGQNIRRKVFGALPSSAVVLVEYHNPNSTTVDLLYFE